MMEQRYALIDEQGLVSNVVFWNGEAAWSPPEGLTAVEADEAVAPGWRLAEGAWLAPTVEEQA